MVKSKLLCDRCYWEGDRNGLIEGNCPKCGKLFYHADYEGDNNKD